MSETDLTTIIEPLITTVAEEIPTIEIPATFGSPVTLCKGGCCPTAVFEADKITITDADQTIVFTKEQAVTLVQELFANGLFQIIIS
jgi:hypothetical protein